MCVYHVFMSRGGAYHVDAPKQSSHEFAQEGCTQAGYMDKGALRNTERWIHMWLGSWEETLDNLWPFLCCVLQRGFTLQFEEENVSI